MDDIRKRLEKIDRELAGPDIGGRLTASSPLVLPAVGLIVGVILANQITLPLWIWLTLSGIAALTAVAVFALRRHKPRPLTIACITGVAFVGLGAVRCLSFQHQPAHDISRLVADEPVMATIRGLIVTEPRINRHPNWAFARFKPTSPGSSFYLELSQIETKDGWMDVAGTVRVQMSQPALSPKAGDFVQAYCWLDRFRAPGNPGQFDTAAYLARRNVRIAASIDSADGIAILPPTRHGFFIRFQQRLRRAVSNALLFDQDMEDPTAGLLQALLLGYRSDIDGRTYEAFRRTGLLHFVSLSGLHMGIVIGAVWWLSKTAGLLHRGRAIVCLIAIVIFVMIVPARAPTLRAAVIAAVFCTAMLFRRRPDSFNTLSLAAVILLLIRPTQLFEAGWQLSFSTVLGILLFTDRIGDGFHTLTRQWFRSDRHSANPWIRSIRELGGRALMLLAVGVSAWLGGIGVMLHHFHTITPLAALWTVLVFPLVAITLVGGFAKILLFWALPSLSSVIGLVLGGVVKLMIAMVKVFAFVDVFDIGMGRVPPIFIAMIYVCIGFIAFVDLPRLPKRLLGIGLVIAVLGALGWVKYTHTYHPDLIITCLNVGHGQAILIQPPGRTNILFDAGSLHQSDPGERIINPTLDLFGVAKLDAAIISHSDVDHLNGLVEVAERFPIDHVYVGNDFLEQTGQWGTAKYLKEQLAELGLTIESVPRNLHSRNGCNISILWPLGHNLNTTLSDNDRSLVCLIEYADRKMLICSDIEEAAQRQILDLYRDLHADIIVTPHHKVDVTSEPQFLERIGGCVFVCSGAQRSMTKEWDQEGITVLHTAEVGAVTVRITEQGQIMKKGFARRYIPHANPETSESE